MSKNLKKYIILFELIICGCFVFLIIKNKDKEPLNVNAGNWQSDYTSYDNGWYIDSSAADISEQVDFLYGPYLDLGRGSYTATIVYDTDYEQECIVSAEEGQNVYIKSGTNKLVRNQKSISFRFTVTKKVEGVEIVVKYTGQGALRVNDIQIRQDTCYLQRTLIYVILLFILFDLFLFFGAYIQTNRNSILAVAGMVLLISLPLFMRGVASGHDLNVHLMRIDGIAQEIRYGNLPVRISSLWMNGHGYPISIYYGDLLLYLPALLRIIGFSVVTAYKAYVFFINLSTVVISYVCFKKIFIKPKIACMVTLAYVTAGYRFVDIYVRSAVGEYSAMMFLPVIALAIYEIYTVKDLDWKQECKNALLLTLGMTGLIGTHILSTQMVVFVLVIVCVVLWKKTLRINTIISYILAVLETIVLNLYFIIPFLDYYFHVQVNINGTINDESNRIQSSGTYIGQLFAFFQNSFGYDSDQITGRLSLTPGIVLMIALLAAIVLWVNQKASKEIKIMTFFSIIMLFAASDLFPWDYISGVNKVGAILSQIQFPWRYIGIAVLFLSLLLGFLFQYLCKEGANSIFEKVCISTAAVCMIMSFFFVSDYCNNASMVFYYDTAELDTYTVGGAEYLRKNTDWVLFPNEVSQTNMKEVSVISREGYRMELYCETAELDGTVEVPIFNYKGFQVIDENGNEYEISDGEYNEIKFSVPADFSGKIIIDFVEPWYWRFGEIVSLIAAAGLCILGIYSCLGIDFKNRNTKIEKKGV